MSYNVLSHLYISADAEEQLTLYLLPGSDAAALQVLTIEIRTQQLSLHVLIGAITSDSLRRMK